MDSSWSSYWLWKCLLASGMLIPASSLSAETTGPRARFVIEGHLANLESFEQYFCRMRVRKGTVEDLDALIKGGPTADVVEGKARLAVDKHRLCYVRETNDTIKIAPGGATGTMSLPPSVIVRSEHSHLDYIAIGGAARVSTEHDGIAMTTWNDCGAMLSGDKGNFARYLLTRITAGIATVEHQGTETRRGHLLTKLVARFTNGLTGTYFIDEARGFIPLETHYELDDGEKCYSAFITDIASCPRSRWFPTRCLVYSHNQRSHGRNLATEIVVTEIAPDQMPPSEFFSYVRPEGTFINDGDSPHSQFAIKQAITITPETIDDLAGRSAKVKVKNLAAEEEFRPKRLSTQTLSLIAAANIAIFGVIAFIWYRRYRLAA